jgi:hypothetical protein
MGLYQALLERTVAVGEVQDVVDSGALCDLLELSGRLSTRRDAEWLVSVQRKLTDALIQMEDTLTHEAIAMAGQVRSICQFQVGVQLWEQHHVGCVVLGCCHGVSRLAVLRIRHSTALCHAGKTR